MCFFVALKVQPSTAAPRLSSACLWDSLVEPPTDDRSGVESQTANRSVSNVACSQLIKSCEC